MKKGKILVTGGAGFIGSALIWELNQRGFDNILVADFLEEDDKYQNLVPLRFDDYMEADDLINTIDEHTILLNDIKTVFHLGACSSTTEKDGRYLIQNNYECSKHLAHWALSHGMRFVYASTAATYGDGSQGMNDEGDIQPLRPLNMYGYSKQLFDLHAQRRGFLDKVAGIKYFNVFGPNEYHKEDMRSLVHKAYKQIEETGQVKLFKSHNPDYADGEQKRDFLYIKDAINMTLHLADTKTANGLFNIGSGEANTWNTLVDGIFKALGKPTNIEYIDMPESLRDKYQYYTCADIAKIRSTGYEAPMTPLEGAVKEYVQDYIAPGKHFGS